MAGATRVHYAFCLSVPQCCGYKIENTMFLFHVTVIFLCQHDVISRPRNTTLRDAPRLYNVTIVTTIQQELFYNSPKAWDWYSTLAVVLPINH